MKKNLKEVHINETNILLEGNLVKGGIIPGKIAELSRIVTIQADTVIDGPVYAAQLEIQSGDAQITGAVFTQRELHVNSDAQGNINFQKCVASSSSVVSRAQKCQPSFHSDINAKSVSLVNAFVAGSIYADEIVLENCVVIGGVFATQSAEISNSIIDIHTYIALKVQHTSFVVTWFHDFCSTWIERITTTQLILSIYTTQDTMQEESSRD